ncbi:MAG: SDR family oxidoreductase [Gordonia sp. (in: high G+C Gram-positive bacteria)]|uniref:SDR family oxidoreductase n=1 Tax=Gordonia sp. (in: high G+C Gram-positive bacteria) TaxID=84139 RepID=UPI0039E3316F
MKIVVIGSTGTMGALVCNQLGERGHEVVEACRATGVDAQSGAGLAAAVDGADVVIDCLNNITTSSSKAKKFFGAAARNIGEAAKGVGARVVCLSICNATEPTVNRRYGYYQGKAEQEAAYREILGDQVTVVRTTQWYELADTITDQMSLGPIAVLPHMLTAPMAASDGAVVIADAADGSGYRGKPVVEVKGPQELDLVDVARASRKARGVRGALIPIRFGGKAFRDGGLIPEHPDVVTAMTLEQWLRAKHA